MTSNIAHQVQIKVSINNSHVDLTYTPSTLHVDGGDIVTWICPDGPFAIEFKKDTPGNQIGVQGGQIGPEWKSPQFPIRQDARGHYHYAVAISLTGPGIQPDMLGRVALDAACPEIIVD